MGSFVQPLTMAVDVIEASYKNEIVYKMVIKLELSDPTWYVQ